jgi:aspartyl protease family protein
MLALGASVPQLVERYGLLKPRSESTAMAAAAPSADAAPVHSSQRSVTVGPDRQGHFRVAARVDGRHLDFMVDTGASVVALTAKDAGRLGLRPLRGEFTAAVKTANGTVRAAPVQLASVDVGGLTIRDVSALVLPEGALSENLLGLSYLSRLRRFEYARGKLVLEQ